MLRLDERPWTSNWARSTRHWSEVAKRTAAWRHAFEVLARTQIGHPLGPCEVVVTPYLADRRGRQDVGGCFPSAKAALDGCVDGGLWPDDTPDWVVALIFRAPIFGQGDGLELELRPQGWTLEMRQDD